MPTSKGGRPCSSVYPGPAATDLHRPARFQHRRPVAPHQRRGAGAGAGIAGDRLAAHYRVRAHGEVTQAQAQRTEKRRDHRRRQYGAIDAALERDQGSNVWRISAIREGKNREVRNVLSHLGLEGCAPDPRVVRTVSARRTRRRRDRGSAHADVREQLGARVVAASSADFSIPVAVPASAPRTLGKKEEARSDVREKAAHGKSNSHSWRAHEQERPAKKLRRKFHGAGRDRVEPREKPVGPARTEVLSDRKGRAVRVERFGQPRPVERPAKPEPKRDHRRRHAPDRASGARPHRPRAR